MIDVSNKFNTLRWAKAQGILRAKTETIKRISSQSVAKGNVLDVARTAGILAAKRTPDWIVFCHPIPMDWIEIEFELKDSELIITAEAKAIWKTGVEMEAITAVTSALLNAYDMLKPYDDTMSYEVKLVEKKGGKNDFSDKFTKPLKTAILVISDSTFQGKRKDKSGLIIKEFLKTHPVDIKLYEILPDDQELITQKLIELVDNEHFDLIFSTGGTGFGPKDFTPEATRPVIEKEACGITESMRSFGKERTPYAMLSREVAGIRKKSLIINLPGSSKGAKESLQALFPGLLHIFPMIRGMGH